MTDAKPISPAQAGLTVRLDRGSGRLTAPPNDLEGKRFKEFNLAKLSSETRPHWNPDLQ